jgi:SAM-dependent methyltransferase
MENYLQKLRCFEVETVKEWFRPGSTVLEIGGGSGYQASLIAAMGCQVLSFDLASSSELATQENFYPVQIYDGQHIPVADQSIDVIFSSNVLEHVKNLPLLLEEMQRVLKPEGVAVHILPSPAWRFWTSMGYFGFVLKSLFGLQRPSPGVGTAPITMQDVSKAAGKRGWSQVVKRAILIPFIAHGEYPNALAEFYYYSRSRWVRVFRDNGFYLEKVRGTGLFYTGYELFSNMSCLNRQHLARFLGSACGIYVMHIADGSRRSDT